MKVVFLVTKLDYSGGPKMISWTANAFAKAGNKVYLLSIYSDEINQPLHDNIEFVPLNYKQSRNWLIRNSVEMIRDIHSINAFVKSINPDLVISFLYSVDFYYILMSKLKKQKIIVSMRLDPYSEKGIAAYVKHEITKLADGLVFQTQNAMNFYGKKVKNKSVVIPNPVTRKTIIYSKDVKQFTDRENIIVLPARLNIKQKRQDVMLKAFVGIYNTYPDFYLAFLGEGPDKERIKCISDELGISNRVMFLGSIRTAEDYVSKCKIMVLTSDYEGMPNALIEAMSIGINVIATDCSPGGAAALIKNGENGFLINRGDAETLTQKIKFLIENPNTADRMAYSAKRLQSELAEDLIAEKWNKFTKKIFNSAK